MMLWGGYIASVQAINTTVPVAPGVNYMLESTTTGQYLATTSIIVGNIIATSTKIASTLPYASTTALTVSGVETVTDGTHSSTIQAGQVDNGGNYLQFNSGSTEALWFKGTSPGGSFAPFPIFFDAHGSNGDGNAIEFRSDGGDLRFDASGGKLSVGSASDFGIDKPGCGNCGIYYQASSGDFGVNTPTPRGIFDVGGGSGLDINLDTQGNTYIGDVSSAGNSNVLTVSDATNQAYYTNGNSSGMFGINNAGPVYALDIVGDANVTGCYRIGGNCQTFNAGTVTSVDGSGGTTGLTVTGGPITTSGTLTLGGTLAVANGGTGQTTALITAITTGSISGAIVGLGCDSADTAAGTTISSTTVFATTPKIYPGDGLTWQSYALNSTTVRTKVCSDVSVVPTASTYNVKIIK